MTALQETGLIHAQLKAVEILLDKWIKGSKPFVKIEKIYDLYASSLPLYDETYKYSSNPLRPNALNLSSRSKKPV